MKPSDSKKSKSPEFLSEDNQTISNEGLYYFENGLMVFTEKFHIKRGYCCGNGCRHCPFKK